MTIAELFVNIGIKGAPAVGRALGSVNQAMGGVAESSIAAKASILAVLYGLERLTGFASQAGMDLTKFNMVTGLSTDELQKWQAELMKFDVSGDEVAGTIKGIQDAMQTMLTGGGAPSGLGRMETLVGFDPTKAKDTFYVLQKLQEFAKTQDAALARQVLGSFHVGENMMQGLKMGSSQLADIVPMSKGVIKSLTAINIAWKNLWFDLKNFGIGVVAKDGMAVVSELSHAFKGLVQAGTYVRQLMDQFLPLKIALLAIVAAIALITAPWTAGAAAFLLVVAEIHKHMADIKKLWAEIQEVGLQKALHDRIAPSIPSDKDMKEKLIGLWTTLKSPLTNMTGEGAAVGSIPGSAVPNGGGSESGGQINQTVTISISGGDHTADSLARAIKQHLGKSTSDAARLIPVIR